MHTTDRDTMDCSSGVNISPPDQMYQLWKVRPIFIVFFLQSKTKSIYFRITYPFFEMQNDQDISYKRSQKISAIHIKI